MAESHFTPVNAQEMNTKRLSIYCKIYKCQNKTCYNFTSNHDLSGTWCCSECFIQSENPELPRLTRTELLQMKKKYDWDLDQHERKELERGLK